MDILEQLYNYLEDDPANITTRELILDAWIQLGDQGPIHPETSTKPSACVN